MLIAPFAHTLVNTQRHIYRNRSIGSELRHLVFERLLKQYENLEVFMENVK